MWRIYDPEQLELWSAIKITICAPILVRNYEERVKFQTMNAYLLKVVTFRIGPLSSTSIVDFLLLSVAH